jgi:hypothetical protein
MSHENPLFGKNETFQVITGNRVCQWCYPHSSLVRTGEFSYTDRRKTSL